MRRPFFLFLTLILIFLGWIFRYELVFAFQYKRLEALSCQEGKADFINDSCLNKIWAHRVNSVERYGLLKGKLAGTETDVTWRPSEKRFRVYHPPLEDKAITLDSFLQAVDTQAGLLWLDTRETPVADTNAILVELDRLNQAHRIKMNAVLELYDLALANYLAGKGYWVALNIDPEKMRSYNQQQWLAFRDSMSAEIAFVSQEDLHVPFLKQHFPGKDIITWSISFNNYFDRAELRQLVNDPRVKIVLVNIKSRGYE